MWGPEKIVSGILAEQTPEENALVLSSMGKSRESKYNSGKGEGARLSEQTQKPENPQAAQKPTNDPERYY